MRNTVSLLAFQPKFYSNGSNAVDLDYTAYIPSSGNENNGPLVMLHGLLLVFLFSRFCQGVPIFYIVVRNEILRPYAKLSCVI